MYYDDSYSSGSRIALSSILLLIIFVSAAALILGAIIWRPWSDGATAASVPEVQGPPQDASGDEAVVAGDAATVEGAAGQ